jgi:competence protein ComEC
VNARPFDPGPIIVTVGAVVGVLLGERAGAGRALGALVAGAVVTLAAIAVRGSPRVVLATVGIALLAAACTQRALDGEVRSPLATFARRGALVDVSGTLVSDPDGPAYITSGLLRVSRVSVDGGPARHVDSRVLVRAGGTDASEWRVLAEGDEVRATGVLRPLVGFDREARWQHAVASLADARLTTFSPPRAPPFRVANALRDVVLRGTQSLDPVDRSLLAGFLLGDTRGVPQAVTDDFRASGLTHLLAVSGENVAFVLALVAPLLKRCSLRGRLAIGLAVLLVFGCATRFEPSVLRAEVMAAFAMAATFVGRPAPAGRLLCGAVIALLVADPFLLHSLGFQLSVAATAAIIGFAPRLARCIPGPEWLRLPLAVSIAAQAGVTPVLLFARGSVPLVSPLTNLVAVPLAEPLTIAGFVFASVAGLAGEHAPRVFMLASAPIAAMLGWVRMVAHAGARVPIVLHRRGALALLSVGAFAAAARHRLGGRVRVDASPGGGAVLDDPARGGPS